MKPEFLLTFIMKSPSMNLKWNRLIRSLKTLYLFVIIDNIKIRYTFETPV